MKYFLPALVSLLLFSSCIKSEKGCEPVPAANEEQQMTKFAQDNGLTVIKHSSGIMYQIMDGGYGATPNQMSTVSVTYVGKLMNGTVFDQTVGTPFSAPLNNLIDGWRVGLQLIKKGGYIKLIIPSSLGYGCTGQGSIPANSPLYFEVQLLNVQ